MKPSFKVRLVKNENRYGHVHREDCLARGYSLSCKPWMEGAFEVRGLIRGLANPSDVELVAEHGVDEGVYFCLRCLPDLDSEAFYIKRARLAAEELGVKP